MEKQGMKLEYGTKMVDARTVEIYLTVKQMAARSNLSESYFTTNASLARHGKKAAPLPPLQKIGRNVRCKESAFYRWMDGGKAEV